MLQWNKVDNSVEALIMKILHTSDWHLGQIFYGYERNEEHRAFLKSLSGIVGDEQPDAMIVCGDVFHNSTPSAAARKIYVDGMLEICLACPGMTVAVIAGNHDSPSRLEADAGLWSHFNVRVIGSFARNADGTADLAGQVVDIVRDGHVLGHIAAVPYASPRGFPEVGCNAVPGDRMSSYFNALDSHMKSISDGCPGILAAHLAVAGCDISGHDDAVGGLDYVPQEILGESYAYIALGHIHKRQVLPGGRAAYCGSPLAVNFDEHGQHSVTVVDMADGGVTSIRTVRIPDIRPLRTVPDGEPEEFSKILDMLAAIPAGESAYVRLNVLVKDTLPSDCEARAADILKSTGAKYCCMKVTRPETKSGAAEYDTFTVQEMKETDPLEVARMYYRLTQGKEMDEKYVAMFREAVRLASGQSADIHVVADGHVVAGGDAVSGQATSGHAVAGNVAGVQDMKSENTSETSEESTERSTEESPIWSSKN